MTDLTLYHNPRCSKSRAALELLQARGLQPHVVRYLETPPSASELRPSSQQVLIAAAANLRELIRANSTVEAPSLRPVIPMRFGSTDPVAIAASIPRSNEEKTLRRSSQFS